MSYVCYAKSEAGNVIEVTPTVTIRFDLMTAITKNRVRKVIESNFNPYGWASKVTAVCRSLFYILPVSTEIVDADLIHALPHELREEIEAKALLLTFKIERRTHVSPWHNEFYLQNNMPNEAPAPERADRRAQVNRMIIERTLPYRWDLWDTAQQKTQRVVLRHLEEGKPFSFVAGEAR